MSLDVSLIDPTATYETSDLYSSNITHNLGEMADKAGIYEALWRSRKWQGYNYKSYTCRPTQQTI